MTSIGAPTIDLWDSRYHDVRTLLPFFQLSHGPDTSAQWLEQKFMHGPGPSFVALARHEGEPAGLVAFGSAPYCSGSKRIKVALSYDTYVVPNFRGRGLFMQLLKRAEDGCTDAGIDFLINFPNAASQPGFRKAGWLPLRSSRPYVRLRIPRTLRDARTIFNLLRGRSGSLSLSSVDPLGPSDLGLLARRPHFFDGLAHSLDLNSLGYRTDAHRGSGYSIVTAKRSAALVRSGVRSGAIEVQLLATAPRELSISLTRELCSTIFKTLNADVISHLESGTRRGPIAVATTGFVPLNARIIPHYKALSEEAFPQNYLLTGIDIHTW